MKFFLQLQLLLWKNYKARKRQKFRCICELTWPLCLFLLLIWVRSKGFLVKMPTCHFEEKPLPSAGLALYYQGLICTFNNTCHKDSGATHRNYSNNSSRLLKFVTDVNSFDKNPESWNNNFFEQYSKDIDDLLNNVSTLNKLQTHTFKSPDSIDNVLLTTQNTGQFIYDSTSQILAIQQRIQKKLEYIEKILDLMRIIEGIDNDYEKLTNILSESPIVEDIFAKLHNFMCGSTSEVLNLTAILKRKKSYESLEKYIRSCENIPNSKSYEYDPDVSETCNKLYEKLETSKVFHIAWKIMKPFIKGKILYSPNTTSVTNIISRIKEKMLPVFSDFNIKPYLPKIDFHLFKKTNENMKFLKYIVENYHNNDSLMKIINTTLKQTVTKSLDLQNQFQKAYVIIEKLNEESFNEKVTLGAEILKCYSSNKFEGYETEKDAEVRGHALCEKNDLLAQISFLNLNGSKLNPMTAYKIRMNTNRFPKVDEIPSFSSKKGANFDPIEDLHFITYGFIYIQDILERSIITELTGRTDSPGYILKQFPHPCHIEDWFMSSLAHMFPLFMVLSWVYTSSMIIKSIVHEKEEKLKEIMHVLGLNNAVHWCSWFIDSFIPMSFTAFTLSIILVNGGILHKADITLVMTFLLSYSFAIISQCFFLSVFFSKANVAATCGGIIFFVMYLPFPFIEYWDNHLSASSKIFSFLSPNVALAQGSKILAVQELAGIGSKWENWTQSPFLEKKITLALIMFMLIIDFVLYFILALYIERVFPGNIGLPKPWYFPFVRNYWIRKRQRKKIDFFIDMPLLNYANEPEPIDLKKGVEIIQLSKTYSNGKEAISNLSIRFYENQITAFLGRNGAGKTTTISILAGLFPPSDGTALIYGQDIRYEMSTIRRSLGVCPQHNILFRCFTVEEHLWFFARLKGHNPGKVQIEIQQILTDLNLIEKKNSLPIYLSGGLKRKLSIGIAFIGGSRTVILDEPTAGVDPYSRAGIWDLLQKYRKGRTIIMTTHIMSEAELLGDRIAIFANGHVLCYGSPTFLKSRFGEGYVLTIDYESENQDIKLDNDKVNDISKEIKNYVPMAEISERFGTEIKYKLPKLGGYVHKYQSLFKYLEINRKRLGINSFGFSDTTLEEVFLKVVDENDSIGEKLQDIKEFEGQDKELIKTRTPVVGRKQFIRQIKALHIKRARHSKRNIVALGLQLLLPVFFVCLCMWITYELPPLEQPKPIYVDHSTCSECLAGFITIDNQSDFWSKKYIGELSKKAGLGSKCIMNGTSLPLGCVKTKIINGTTPKKRLGTCHCTEDGRYSCPPCSDYPRENKIVVSSGKEILNISSKDISQWLIDTWHCYERTRRGGYTFGIDLPQRDTSFSGKVDANVFNNSTKIPKYYKQNDNIMIWFNNRWKISPVIYLNNINNIILRASLPANVSSDHYGLKLYIHPMNYTKQQYEYEYRYRAASALLHSIALIFALSFIPASFVIYLIEERVSNSKHLQFLSGVNWVLYWFQALMWDMACYVLSIILCVISLIIFKAEAYTNPRSLPGLTLLLILYGWAVIPLMYPASFIFDVPSSAFVSLACLNIVLGVTTTASSYVLKVFNDEYLTEIERVLRNIFVLLPHFCLGEGILKIAEMHVVTHTLSLYGVKLETDLLSIEFLGKNFLSLFAAGIIFFCIVLLLESFQYYRLFSEHRVSLDPPNLDDDDVIAERNRVLNSEIDDVLVLKCLTKIYSANRQVAVNQLCLGVNKGECFGLLGLNGAGKTTTFKMLTGDITITFGDAYVLGYSIRNKLPYIKSLIGYCPQFDALHSRLTPQEHLEFYSHLRNIPPSDVDELVQESLKKFDLLKFKNVCTQYLSGGNKRKLSTAIALLGNSHLIFLDEPTSGMDPKGRRFLWSRIKNCVLSGRAVVLTSHSMSECESLCTRVTIMVDGQFKCLGSTQHLKNKYGRGYNLAIRAPTKNAEHIKRKILMMFPTATEISTHCSQIKFEINVDIVSLSRAFNLLEAMMLTSLIEDYSISQKSLEEIFFQFIRTQHGEKANLK